MKNDSDLAAQFAQCSQDVRDWAESAGYENLQGRIASGTAISSQAATLLALLLAGIGGALSFAVRLADATPATPPSPSHYVPVAACILCVLFGLLAAVLTIKCLLLGKAPTLYNEPKHLLMPGGTLEQLRCGELVNLQKRIEEQKCLVLERSRWLNFVRLAAIASPVIAAAIAVPFR